MVDFSAGTVYVQVLPSLDGWRKAVVDQAKNVGDVRVRATIEPHFDKTAMETALAGLKIKVTPQFDVGTSRNEAEALRAELDAILGRGVTINADADVGKAVVDLERLDATASAVDGKTVDIRADDHGSLGGTTTRMERLLLAVTAGSGAIGGLAAGFLALAAGAVVGAAGLAAVAIGAKAIGAAMKAQTAASQQAGQTAAQEAAQRLTAANQVLNAQDALKAAARGVADAQRSASESVRSALLTQARAEETLQAAQLSALRAQQELTGARQDAARSIEDLTNKVIDDALSQREAVIKLRDAELALKKLREDPTATTQQLEEAQLLFDQKTQQLAEISLSYRRSQVDAKAASVAGVEGSRQVVSAQDAIVASQRQLHDAQVASAESAHKVDEARLTGAQQVATAQEQVVHAQRSLTQAQAASATQALHQGQAHQKLADALDRLSPQSLRLIEYLRAQGGEWQSLTKASQGFAPGLQKGLQELEPSFGALNANVSTLSTSAGDFLHVIARGLVGAQPFFDTIAASSQTLFPRFGETVNRAAGAVGQLTLDMLPLAPAALDTVDAFAGLIKTWSPFIAQASGPLLTGLQGVIKNLDFLGPLLVSLAQPVADLTNALVGGLREAFVHLTPELGPLLQSLVDLVKAVVPLIGSAGELAAVLARSATPAIEGVTFVLKPIVAIVGDLVHLFASLPTPVTGAVIAFAALSFASGPLGKLLGGISKSLTNVGQAAGWAAVGMGGSATTAGKFATAGERVGGVVSKMGSAIPIAGAALIGIGELFAMQAEHAHRAAEAIEKWGAALLAGGSLADAAGEHIRMLRDQQRQAAQAGNDSAALMSTIWGKTADAIEGSAKRQQDSMTGVELAQLRVAQAQRDYDKAVQDFGPTSGNAVAAHGRLVSAVDTSKRAQYDAAQAAKSYTERLQDQQDQILAMADASAAKDRAGLQLERARMRIDTTATAQVRADKEAAAAKDKLSAATKQFGKNSEAAQQAQASYVDALDRANSAAVDAKESQLDLTSAQSRYIATSGDAAAATAKAGGAWDTAAASMHGSNEALVGLLRTQSENLPPAMLSALAHLDEVDKKFYGLTTTIDGTGQTILTLPGGPGQPPVEIKFHDNVPDIQADISTLKTELSDLDKWINDLLTGKGVGPTSLAGLLGLVGPTVSTPGKPAGAPALPGLLGPLLGRAAGGPIPGSGNSDTYPALLTPGEFVWSKPAVNHVGVGNVAAMHAAARRGYAQGGVVGGRFAAGGPVATSSGADPAGWLTSLVLIFESITTVTSPLALALKEQLVPALGATFESSAQLAAGTVSQWSQITTTIATSTALINDGYLTALRQGLALVNVAVGQTAATFGSQFALIRAYAADPVRFALQFPFNSLIAAWNLIDSTFAVGKPLAPFAVPFAVGGQVPGAGNKDSVRAYLTPGEYVLSKPAIANLGGLAVVERLHQLARAGAIGPDQRLGGRPGDAALRMRLMRTIPLDGLGFAYGGVQPHVAAAGAEVEQRFGPMPGGIGGVGVRANISDHPLGLALDFMTMTNSELGNRVAGYLQANAQRLAVKYLIWQQQINEGAGWSGMEDRGSITANHFDHVHSSFLAAGLPGHGFTGAVPGFDLAASFAATRDAIAAIGPAFGANTLAAGASAELTRMVDTVVGWATSNLIAAAGTPGSGPVVDQVRGVAARFGWGEGPQWDALSTLISHESSWNPAAQNPTSTAFGLLQLLDGTWAGTGIGKSDNPAVQAEAGARYIQGRYGDPVNAWNFWMGHHWYDDGGYLPPGLSLAYNGTGRPEPVATPAQWNSLAGQNGGGAFTGTLTLDSGEFLGMVRGEVNAANDATGRAIARRTRM